MGLLDRLNRPRGTSGGVPGRALVVVNRTGGGESGASSSHTLLRVRLRPLPEGSGPEGDVAQMLRSHPAYLLTAGMEVPALLDPDTGEPVGVAEDGLEEAIGRYYLTLEPEHGTWQAALESKLAALRESESWLGPMREEVGQIAGAAKALPRGVRDTVREWRTGLKSLGDSHPAGEPVSGVSFEAWCEVKAGLARDAIAASEATAYAAARGIPAEKWPAIDSTWEQRVQWNTNARALYDKAMADSRSA